MHHEIIDPKISLDNSEGFKKYILTLLRYIQTTDLNEMKFSVFKRFTLTIQDTADSNTVVCHDRFKSLIDGKVLNSL